MSKPPTWPHFMTQGPSGKADILLDTTCFSTSDFDYFDTSVSQDHSLPSTSNLTKPEMQNQDSIMEMLRRKALANGVLDTQARYYHPTFPPATFLTTLIQQERFKEYISNEFPSLNCTPLSTANHEPLRKEVNATIANSLLLNSLRPTTLQVGTTEWVRKAIFPDEVLPVVFNDKCLDNVPECWDMASQRFSNFPDTMNEHAVQNWLNHLAHTLGVQHGLIKEEEEPEGLSTCDDDEDGSVDEVDSDMKKGFVVAGAEDRSFSIVSHKKAPSGGYRLRKPDIILINRNLRHFLKDGRRRPRWLHVEAIVEVSLSASRESMLQQILEKAALMFETQPFRRFAIGLALRRTDNPEFCFMLVDRAGVCQTNWEVIAGYEAINLTCIVFGLSYASPQFLGIDTSMTVDLFSGDVTKIKVEDQEFNVIKHIYSSLNLFGRGTHVFLVQDKDGKFHVLKDAWIRADHGISEIDILSSISETLKNDPSPDAQKYRLMHPRFVVGKEMSDSTTLRRGRLTNMPPARLHRRVVTGPVGDPLTSFRSRAEFVKVLLDCVDWLKYLHTKCNMVHGDLSVNNIVIYRAPLPHPPLDSLPRMELPGRRTRAAQAAFTPAPVEGLAESISVTGIVIDYDYARLVGTTMEKTSGTLPFMSLASLDKETRPNYIHSPSHDLESLLQTALGVVTFSTGPCGQIRALTDRVPLARWYNEIDLEQLRKDKAIDLIQYEKEILNHIPEYWKPFSPYLNRLIRATWPESNPFSDSAATHDTFRQILQDALTYFTTNFPETPCKYARVTKRSRPSVDEGRYPYKLRRRDVSDTKRLPQLAVVKPLSQWTDSVDVGSGEGFRA